jgi:signal transduction protein with GAF and PtsI domain
MKKDQEQEITQLQDEINLLRKENQALLQQIEQETFKDRIKQTLGFIDILTVISSTNEEKVSFKNLLILASLIVDAEAASILLYDKKSNMLYFEEAVGEKSEEVKKFKVKPNEGIAGYCFSTGEALAVSDVMKDPRFKKEIAIHLEMKQKALLAVPLIYGHEVVGVLEAINKRGGESFNGHDVEVFSMLANFIASYIQRTNAKAELYSLFLTMLKNAVTGENMTEFSIGELTKLSKDVENELLSSQEYGKSIELAALMEEISAAGSNEFDFVRSILLNFKQYIKDHGQYDMDSLMDWA